MQIEQPGRAESLEKHKGSATIKKLCISYRPIFTKVPKYCFNTSNGAETITVSFLFRRRKNSVFFNPPGIGKTPTLTSSKRTQHLNTPFATEARVEQQTHSGFFFTGGPSAVVCVCRCKCVVGKLPCNALAIVWALAQTDCQAFATTHLCRLFFHVNVWLDGPWRRHSFKRRQHHEDAMAARTKRPNKRAFWTLPFGTIWQSLFLCTRLPEGRQKAPKNSKSNGIFFWSHNSVGCKVRSSRPSAGKFLASPYAHDDVEPTPLWRTPSCKSLGNHLQQKKSTTNKP